MNAQGSKGGGGDSGGEIDLFELWDILWGGKRIAILSGFICTLFAVAFALLATPIYEARVVMISADDSSGKGLEGLAGKLGGLATLAGIGGGRGSSKTDLALAMLDSYAFNANFIEQNDLLPVLFAERWDAVAQQWLIEDTAKQPTLQKATQVFRQKVRRIDVDKKSGAVTITVRWSDPDLVASWANGLVSKINAQLREQDIAEAQKAIRYLQSRVEETANVEIQKTLFNLIESQTKTITLASVRDEYVFRVVDPAFVPERRISPLRTRIVISGGLLGGMLGVLLIFVRRVVLSYKARKIEIGVA